MINDDWRDFKTFVKEMRALVEATTRRQQGGNQIMPAIALVDYSINDWVHINPHSIDLRTGKGTVLRQGRYYFDVDIKHLLLTQRWKEVQYEI